MGLVCFPGTYSLCWVCGGDHCEFPPLPEENLALPLLSKKKQRNIEPRKHKTTTTMEEYLRFIESKRHTLNGNGFDPVWFPDCAFPFQRHIISRAVQMGRLAIFADTGLGKTLIQLSIANNVVLKTNKKVLILTPLAVAFQFVQEAERIGIDDIEYCRDGKHSKKIVICNYERLHLFDSSDFECVILDESSILKNFEGKIKESVTVFMRKIKYRYLSTATPSPNDYIELGTSSEALGYMGHMDMMTKFFKNAQNSIDSNHRGIGDKYYLKPHAKDDFFAWVNQWSVMVKMPSDIGFSNDGYILPELIVNKHLIINDSLMNENGQILLFAVKAKSFYEVRHEQKATVAKRCEKAVELAQGKTSVYWCNLNDESDAIARMDKDAVEIRGAMSIEKKEDILMAFANGDIDRIITKAKMTGMGLNWQHCNHSVFFPTWSYEQYYQAIRRFWRFGQKRPVTIDMVVSDGQSRVLDTLENKTKKAVELYQNLVNAVNKPYLDSVKEFNKPIIKPSFIK